MSALDHHKSPLDSHMHEGVNGNEADPAWQLDSLHDTAIALTDDYADGEQRDAALLGDLVINKYVGHGQAPALPRSTNAAVLLHGFSRDAFWFVDEIDAPLHFRARTGERARDAVEALSLVVDFHLVDEGGSAQVPTQHTLGLTKDMHEIRDLAEAETEKRLDNHTAREKGKGDPQPHAWGDLVTSPGMYPVELLEGVVDGRNLESSVAVASARFAELIQMTRTDNLVSPTERYRVARECLEMHAPLMEIFRYDELATAIRDYVVQLGLTQSGQGDLVKEAVSRLAHVDDDIRFIGKSLLSDSYHYVPTIDGSVDLGVDTYESMGVFQVIGADDIETARIRGRGKSPGSGALRMLKKNEDAAWLDMTGLMIVTPNRQAQAQAAKYALNRVEEREDLALIDVDGEDPIVARDRNLKWIRQIRDHLGSDIEGSIDERIVGVDKIGGVQLSVVANRDDRLTYAEALVLTEEQYDLYTERLNHGLYKNGVVGDVRYMELVQNVRGRLDRVTDANTFEFNEDALYHPSEYIATIIERKARQQGK